MLPDEANEDSDAVLEEVRTAGAIVPSLWPIEIAHVLLKAERRRRLGRHERLAALTFLKHLQ